MFTVALGCSHQQQIIWQLLNAAEKGFAASGDDDMTFINGERLVMFLDSRQLNVP